MHAPSQEAVPNGRPSVAKAGLGPDPHFTLRRALVRCDRAGDDRHAVRDCADLLLSSGAADAARLLYETLWVEDGFSSGQRRRQAELARRTGLWNVQAWPEPGEEQDGGGSALDRAIRDLCKLIAIPARDAPQPSRAGGPAGALPLGELVSELCDCLRDGGVDRLRATLDAARGMFLATPAIALSDRLESGSVADLAEVVAFNRLRCFLLATQDLAFAPLGSAKLFAAAARLEDGALSPYLRNVARLIRSVEDVLGLVRLAGGADQSARWCALLATQLGEGERIALAEHLGDLGMVAALRELLGAALRRGEDRGLYWAIRDAALDLGELDLAADAQRAILPFGRQSAVELVVLARILASAGDSFGATTTLGWAVLLHPGDRSARRSMAALLRGHIAHFVARRGFGTPTVRTALRRAVAARGAAE